LLILFILNLLYYFITFHRNAFKTRHKSDLLKGSLMLLCCIALQYIDVSRLYHFVRGQNIVKLYLIYNLMEVRLKKKKKKKKINILQIILIIYI